MSLTAFLLIVVSACLHATWNLMAKKNKMNWLFYTILGTMCWIVWSHVLIWTPVPYSRLPKEFWFWLLGSTTAAELFYCSGVCWSYRCLEMSVAYPMMRSLPVLSVALVTSILGLGSALSPIAAAGMVVVFSGCLLMPLVKFSDFSFRRYLDKGMVAVLMTALGTTCYTVCDSQAQKVMVQSLNAMQLDISNTTITLSYYIIRLSCLCSFLWAVVFLVPANRKSLKEDFFRLLPSAAPAGVFASGCYILALMAMLHVTNVSYVQVFRQMGLILGMLAGVVFLKERLTITKVVGVLLIVGGLVMTVIEKFF